MKINFSAKKDIFLTSKQQKYIEQRLSKLKRFIKNKDEAVTIDIKLNDETGGAKGGSDKNVNITVQIPGEQAPIHINDREDKIMRAFNMAIGKIERQLRDEHKRLVKANKTGGRLDKIWKIIRRSKRENH